MSPDDCQMCDRKLLESRLKAARLLSDQRRQRVGIYARELVLSCIGSQI